MEGLLHCNRGGRGGVSRQLSASWDHCTLASHKQKRRAQEHSAHSGYRIALAFLPILSSKGDALPIEINLPQFDLKLTRLAEDAFAGSLCNFAHCGGATWYNGRAIDFHIVCDSNGRAQNADDAKAQE